MFGPSNNFGGRWHAATHGAATRQPARRLRAIQPARRLRAIPDLRDGAAARLAGWAATPPLWLRVVGGAGLVAAALVVGVVAVMLGERTSPAVVVALAVLPIVAVLCLADPVRAVALVVLSLPVGARALPGVPLQVVEVAALAAFALVVVGRLGRGEEPLRWAPALGWVLALAGVAVASAAGALDRDAAIRQVGQLVVGIGFAVAVVSAAERPGQARRIAAYLTVVGGAVCLAALPGATRISATSGLRADNRAESVFTSPNQLGSMAAIVVFVAIGLWASARTPKTRALWLGAAAVSGATLLATLSRGAWIGTAVGLLVIATLLPEARRKLLAVGIPALGLMLALGATAPEHPQVDVVRERLGSLASPAENPYDDRPTIFAEGVRQALDRPWLGQGPGGFPAASAKPTSDAQTVGALHAHNVLLTVAAELGIPAMVLVVAFTAAVGVRARRRVRDALAVGGLHEAGAIAGLAAALATLIGQGVVDYTFRNPILFLTVWLVVGLVLSGGSSVTGTMPTPEGWTDSDDPRRDVGGSFAPRRRRSSRSWSPSG